MRNADSWGMAFIVFGTAAVMMALPAKPDLADRTLAQKSTMTVPADEVAYKISVKAQRVPTECKGLTEATASDVIVRCQAIATGETQMTLIPLEGVQVANQPQQ